MKQMIKNLTAIAVLSFTLSFVIGLSASVMYQEHQSLKPIMAAQEQPSAAEDTLLAELSVPADAF